MRIKPIVIGLEGWEHDFVRSLRYQRVAVVRVLHASFYDALEAKRVADKALFALGDSVLCQYNMETPDDGGYKPEGNEYVGDASQKDAKRMWHVVRETYQSNPLGPVPISVWPKELADHEFKLPSLEYFRHIEHIALQLLGAFEDVAMGGRKYLSSLAIDGRSVLRTNYYPALSKVSGTVPADGIRNHAHKDINMMTLIPYERGYEIEIAPNVWMEVEGEEKDIIVATGKQMAYLTNCLLLPVEHRVMFPEDPEQERYSVPFFVHAKLHDEFVPYPAFCGKDMPELPPPVGTLAGFLSGIREDKESLLRKWLAKYSVSGLKHPQ